MMVPGLLRLRDRFDALLLDLDGTLLNRAGRLTKRTVRAVRALAHHGFQITICTGRSLAGTLPAYRELDLGGVLVSYNGHWIGVPGEEPWHVLPIPDETVGCIQIAEEHAQFTFRHHDERKYTLLSSHPDHLQVLSWYESTFATHNPADLPTSGLMRVSLFADGYDDAEIAWTAMSSDAQTALHREVFPLSLFPGYDGSSLVLLELQKRSRGKAEAYGYLHQVHKIPPLRTIAIGDHRNDLTMLETAGYAIVPANAAPEARQLADLVIGHHDKDGVAAWVEAGAPLDPELWLAS